MRQTSPAKSAIRRCVGLLAALLLATLGYGSASGGSPSSDAGETDTTVRTRSAAINADPSLRTTAKVEVPDGPDSVEGDHQALMDLYDATNGDDWRNNDGWGGPSDSMGDWYGIKTNDNGRVVTIKLNGNSETKFEDGRVGGNGLEGTLPDSLGNLKKVTYFNVKNNQLSGTLPDSIGDMVSLKHLLLNGRIEDVDWHAGLGYQHPGKPPGGRWADQRSNNYSGPLPASIGNLTNLTILECTGTGVEGDTGLEGSLPDWIGNLTNLEGLLLSYNSINGLPDSMGNLTNLIQFGLTGPQDDEISNQGIPGWMTNWSNLRYLIIGGTKWGDDLPDLSGLTSLRVLNLAKAGLSGPFPDYLADGTLPDLNMMSVSWNSFSGTLPEFGDLDNLRAYTITDSNLTGPLPDSFWSTGNDQIINTNFDHNELSGPIKSNGNLRNLKSLRNLRCGNNNFSGQWPELDWTNQQGLENSAGTAMHPLRNFTRAHFHGNRFVFADMLVVSDKGKTLFEWYQQEAEKRFLYAPQQPFGSTSDLNGSTIDFSDSVYHEDNDYDWYHNGNRISGENTATIDASDYGSGTYTLEVTNPGVPELTLESVDISY